MMSRHFRLSSELTGAIAKKLPHAKNQLSTPSSFFNQFVTDIYIYTQTNNNRVLIVRIHINRVLIVRMSWKIYCIKLPNLKQNSLHGELG